MVGLNGERYKKERPLRGLFKFAKFLKLLYNLYRKKKEGLKEMFWKKKTPLYDAYDAACLSMEGSLIKNSIRTKIVNKMIKLAEKKIKEAAKIGEFDCLFRFYRGDKAKIKAVEKQYVIDYFRIRNYEVVDIDSYPFKSPATSHNFCIDISWRNIKK